MKSLLYLRSSIYNSKLHFKIPHTINIFSWFLFRTSTFSWQLDGRFAVIIFLLKHFRNILENLSRYLVTLQYRLPGFGCSFQTFELRKEAKNIRSFLLWSNRDISWNRWNKENKNIVSSKVSFEINELVISENKRQRQVYRLLIRKRRLINVNTLISGKITFSLRQINSFFLKWACVEPRI